MRVNRLEGSAEGALVTASPRGVNGLMSCISRGMAEAAVALVKAAEMDLVMQQDEEGLVRQSAEHLRQCTCYIVHRPRNRRIST